MTRYYTKISEPLRRSAKEKGFDPNSKVIPSAAGMPLRSSLGPKEFAHESRLVIRTTRHGVKHRPS
jgi:hypothetical protein